MLNKQKLEETLIKNWTEFFDIREILNYIKLHLPSTETNINNLKTTRFELTSKGFILWLEYTITKNDKKYNSTSEILMDFNGNFHYLNTESHSI